MSSEEIVKDKDKVLLEIIDRFFKENRRRRITGDIFKFLFLLYLAGTFYSFFFLSGFKVSGKESKPHLGVVDIVGPIARGNTVNDMSTVSALRKAFKDKNTVAVVLNANSPGGSPTQADVINEELWHLKKEYPKKPVYAVVGDVCASGCYFIISAADKIWMDPSSMIGSVGVKMEGFGYTGLMQKLGVTRRSLALGAHKTMMDPFLPPDTVAQSELKQNVLQPTLKSFIAAVERGRGSRLDTKKDIFNGMVWSGQKALDLGFADRFGNIHELARKLVKDGAIVDYTTVHHSFKDVLLNMITEFSGKVVASLSSESGAKVQL